MNECIPIEMVTYPSIEKPLRIEVEENQQGTEQEQILGEDHPISNQISVEEELELQEFPPMKLPNLSGYAIRCWGYRGSIISHPNLANPTSSCIHPSTHNQETFGNRVPQPSKSICYTSYGNTPELPPQYWVVSRLSHQQLHKRDFRCRRNSGIPELQR